MYSIERRMLIVHEYRQMSSFIQMAFQNKYNEQNVRSKSCIHRLVKKLEIIRSFATQCAGGRKMSDHMGQDVKN